jgi:hypothetical protein
MLDLSSEDAGRAAVRIVLSKNPNEDVRSLRHLSHAVRAGKYNPSTCSLRSSEPTLREGHRPKHAHASVPFSTSSSTQTNSPRAPRDLSEIHDFSILYPSFMDELNAASSPDREASSRSRWAVERSRGGVAMVESFSFGEARP